jgi:hypothetical protein
MIPNNMPLGLMCRYNPTTNKTEVCWSYIQDSDITHFVLEYWDENERKFKPYDNLYGIILRDKT